MLVNCQTDTFSSIPWHRVSGPSTFLLPGEGPRSAQSWGGGTFREMGTYKTMQRKGSETPMLPPLEALSKSKELQGQVSCQQACLDGLLQPDLPR